MTTANDFKPGDIVIIHDDLQGVTMVRTVHSVYYATNDLESDGIHTTRGDWFAFDDVEIRHHA